MKPNTESRPAQPQTSNRQPLVLGVAAFVLGVALAGAWFHHQRSGSESSGGLSTSTQKLLGQLAAPVTIRYYSLLPNGTADESLQAFAGRVAHLLDNLQSAGGGKIEVSRFDQTAETNANAASADGIMAFNLDKGDACFLGLVVTSGKNTESLARLQPEWEPALESDLARAILRVAGTAAPARVAPEVAKPSSETIATINRLIPDVNAVSAEQAGQIFNAEYLKQCGTVGAEMEAQVNAAAQQVVQAQNSGSATELEAAQKQLAQAQLTQGEKLKDLAAQLQIQQAVFQRLKSGATNDAK